MNPVSDKNVIITLRFLEKREISRYSFNLNLYYENA